MIDVVTFFLELRLSFEWCLYGCLTFRTLHNSTKLECWIAVQTIKDLQI